MPVRTVFPALLLAVVLLLSPASTLADAEAGKGPAAPPGPGKASLTKTRARADALVARGDKAFVKGDRGRAPRSTWAAIGCYREALKVDPKHFEALWRLARAFMWLGEQSSSSADHRRLGWKGYGYALRAIQVDQRRVEGHFWAALCIGEYAKGLGVISAIRQGIERRFRGYLDASMRIDRSYDEGGPDRIYALYWHSLPWPLRDNKKSLYHFRRSLGYSRTNPFTHLYYGKVLAAESQEAKARRHFQRCIGNSTSQGDRVLARRCRHLLRELDE
jgi:tetratricopeptide (TPR) repeat protein